MMPHLAPVAPSTPKPLISAFSRNTVPLLAPPAASHRFSASTLHQTHVQRRDVVLGLAGVVLGLSTGGRNAWAAARRPPPPPPEEKKDPNVTGLAAKILANKKRKEALKETITKLREKGKTIEEPSQ